MDNPAFQTVAKGTFITSVTAGLGVGAYELFKGRPIGVLASASALNSGLVAATFFSIREYAVSPLLVSSLPWKQYETRRRALELGPTYNATQSTLSWSDLRTYNLFDTGISGGLTGALLYSWKRGRPGLVPGFCTGAVACTLLQWTYNELGIGRVKYVSRMAHSQVTPAVPASQHSLPAEPSKWWGDKVLQTLGFHSLSDEELLAKLKATRDRHLRRIEVLEKDMENKNREESADSGRDS